MDTPIPPVAAAVWPVDQLDLGELLPFGNAAGLDDSLDNLTANGYADDPYANYTCGSAEMNTVIHQVLMSFYAAVFCGGFVGNAAIIYTVLRGSGMQTVTNRYILNLALADECYLIGMPLLIYTMGAGEWVFGRWTCKAYMVSTSITQFTSSLFLLIMSADRYVAICHHISSPKYRTVQVARGVSMLAWLASALMISPIVWHADVIDRGGGRFTCSVVWPSDGGPIGGSLFTVYTFVCTFLVPLVFIVGFYSAVLMKLGRVSKRAQGRSAKSGSRHKKVTRLVLAVVVVYMFCWLPYWVGQVTLVLQSDRMCSSRLEVLLFVAAGCLGYLNSAINPVLYAYLSDNFRKSLVKTFWCLRWCADQRRRRSGVGVGGGGGGGVGCSGGSGANGGAGVLLSKKPGKQGEQHSRLAMTDGSCGGGGTDGDGLLPGGRGRGGRNAGRNGGYLQKVAKRSGSCRRGSDTQMTMVTRAGGDGSDGEQPTEFATTVTTTNTTMSTVASGSSAASRNHSPHRPERDNELLPLSMSAA